MSDEKAYNIKLKDYFKFVTNWNGICHQMYKVRDGVWECFLYNTFPELGKGQEWDELNILQNLTSGAWTLKVDDGQVSLPKVVSLSEAVAMVKADIEEPSIEITKKVVVKIKGVTYQAEGEEADKLVELHKQYQILKSVMDALKKYEAK